jgi:hypothetical protein
MATPKKRVLQQAFLDAYRLSGNVTEASLATGIHRMTHYKWLDRDANYKAEFAKADIEATEHMEAEARRRAMIGWDEPVFQKGQQVMMNDGGGNLVPARIRKYSDTLLIFLLKGRNPDKYADRQKTDVDLKTPDSLKIIIGDDPVPGVTSGEGTD